MKLETTGFKLNQEDGSFEKKQIRLDGSTKQILIRACKKHLIVEGFSSKDGVAQRCFLKYNLNGELTQSISISHKIRPVGEECLIITFAKTSISPNRRCEITKTKESGFVSTIYTLTLDGREKISETFPCNICLTSLPFEYDPRGMIKHQDPRLGAKKHEENIRNILPKLQQSVNKVWNEKLNH